MGKQHAKAIRQLNGFEVIGFVDNDSNSAEESAKQFGGRAFATTFANSRFKALLERIVKSHLGKPFWFAGTALGDNRFVHVSQAKPNLSRPLWWDHQQSVRGALRAAMVRIDGFHVAQHDVVVDPIFKIVRFAG